MNIFDWLKPFARKTEQALVKNAPHILMGLGTGCSISALISAVKAAPEASRAVGEKRHEKACEERKRTGEDIIPLRKLTLKEWILAVWKYYGPAAAMELLALVCFWSAHGIDIHRQAVLSGLCATAEQALREYQRKVQQMIGEKAEKEVKNAVVQDRVDANPPPQNTVILSEDADLWCIIDGQYFRSSYLKIKEAQNDANHEMIQHMYISKADLFWLLDPAHQHLKPTATDGQVGWNVDEMLVLDIDTAMGPDHRPILSIAFRTKDGYPYPPQPGFSRML